MEKPIQTRKVRTLDFSMILRKILHFCEQLQGFIYWWGESSPLSAPSTPSSPKIENIDIIIAYEFSKCLVP